jgi:uncharacterized protein
MAQALITVRNSMDNRTNMKHLLLFSAAIFLLSNSATFAQEKDYPISAVPFTQVKLSDNFWLPRIRTNHAVTIPASFERCESTGRIRNFEMAAARSGKFCTVYPFDDTDIYKTIEGASFSLSLIPDKNLELYIDTLIQKIAAAQEPDGYLYTARTINPVAVHAWAGKERWEKERELSHELYNSGHLFEAAAAHFQATGKRNLLDIALKNADLVCSVFGPEKKHVAPGHQVVEMGLVKLYRITGKKEYLSTAKFFIEERGHFAGYDSASNDPFKNGAYWQDHKPVVDQDEAVGHAVRAGYLYAAIADVAALTGDPQFLNAIDKIWSNVVGKKIYVQGGIGASGEGERFGGNYELPNPTAYNETCAAIANVYWNQRMFQLHGESKYIDILERTLYNGLISGVGMDGKSFFYTNAMEIKNNHGHRDQEGQRSGWFTCSCCPTNVTRLIPSVPGYMYAVKDNAVYINLFANSTASVNVGKKKIVITQENNYPWDGDLKFRVNASQPGEQLVLVRIPGWALNQAMPSDLYSFRTSDPVKVPVSVNGKAIDYVMQNGYAVIKRSWKKDDVLEVKLPMDVHRLVSNEKVEDNLGKVALQRGPLVYCAEGIDNNGLISNLILPEKASFTTEYNPDLLNGIAVVKSEAVAIAVSAETNSVSTKTQPFMAIPYYAWAHRGKGEMMIWFPQQIKAIDIISK